jgi:hypothetical protein
MTARQRRMATTASQRLRRNLVAEMRVKGVLSSARVEAAFLAVASRSARPMASATTRHPDCAVSARTRSAVHGICVRVAV